MFRGEASEDEDEEDEPLKKDLIPGEELAGGEVWKMRPWLDGRISLPAVSPASKRTIVMANPVSDAIYRGGPVGCVNAKLEISRSDIALYEKVSGCWLTMNIKGFLIKKLFWKGLKINLTQTNLFFSIRNQFSYRGYSNFILIGVD